MRKTISLVLLVISGAFLAHSQETNIPVKVKAALFDRDLNQKPVAKTRFTLVPKSTDTSQVTFVTSFDGIADLQLAPGKYRLLSSQPTEFQNKRYSWDLEVTIAPPSTTIEISNDNATSTEIAVQRPVDDLVAIYKQYRNAVVTVLAEYGPAKGTGFIIDKAGLVLTNQHVVRTSEFIAVELDDNRRLPAKLLAADPERDVAVLWVNFQNAPDVLAVPLLKEGETPAEEGDKVFTIGSPLHQSKVMTAGIVSKVEKKVIISDININHGNSGGPLFNPGGKVIGITTFGDVTTQGGPGISGIVRIEEAYDVINRAKASQAKAATPSGTFLLNEPEDKYPLEAIKANALEEKFKTAPYIFGVGDYDVAIITPILRYREYSGGVQAAKAKEKRNRKSEAAVQNTFRPLDELKGWEEYVGEYKPVIWVQVSPKLKETFWSAFGRSMAASHGYLAGPASLHFKTDFYRMSLMCGDKEVQPIFPGKAQRVLNINNAAVRITDATFDGFYEYPYDAIRPDCGRVSLQIFSEKNPQEAKVKELDSRTINTVAADFEPYRKQLASKP